MNRFLAVLALLVVALIGAMTPASAADASVCNIPRGGDADSNGIGDVGVQVVCNYTSLYAYDATGNYYWDLGDGRVQSSPGVTGVADLDQGTLSVCNYVIQTKGSFENDPYQDTGVISNMIRCSGYDGNATFNYQIVAQGDPRYTGNPDLAIWGTWEYHVNTQSGSGNLVHTLNRPGR